MTKGKWVIDRTIGCRENPGYFWDGALFARHINAQFPGIVRIVRISDGRKWYRKADSDSYVNSIRELRN